MSFQQSKAALLCELEQILTYRRPAGSDTEKEFVAKFVDTIPGVKADSFGNRFVTVGAPNGLAFSCHTDSVHRETGRQSIFVKDGFISLKDKKASSCLGADCGTGVWLMRQMISHRVPGLYIFHREEEIGGNGSRFIATKTPGLLAKTTAIIAFDRRGNDSVITHQGNRTASDKFADSLATHLGGKFKPDPTGLFTDTANYIDIVGECSNISVGYHNAHSSEETQDAWFALDLLETLLTLRIENLTIDRKPGEMDFASDWGWQDWPLFDKSKKGKKSATRERRRGGATWDDIAEAIADQPEAAACLLEELGMEPEAILQYLESLY